MTDSVVRPPAYELKSILGLDLPAHVLALIDDTWRPAWLISRLHHADGWMGLIQYTDADGCEQTCRVPTSRLGPMPVS
ncbi:hypothetical protein [Kribbella catacumbae]|uniref:hypothetical protein n=1 Tax=Kribbella catacumbae TaxID=460086 RepID=UPI000365BC3A|nr:hypothetical protein [Kribbella catacumbae]